MVGGGRPTPRKNMAETDPSLKNADHQFIFVRSASAVTPSEKTPVNTNRKCTTSFPMNPI